PHFTHPAFADQGNDFVASESGAAARIIFSIQPASRRRRLWGRFPGLWSRDLDSHESLAARSEIINVSRSREPSHREEIARSVDFDARRAHSASTKSSNPCSAYNSFRRR